jgi:hypothetical protein
MISLAQMYRKSQLPFTIVEIEKGEDSQAVYAKGDIESIDFYDHRTVIEKLFILTIFQDTDEPMESTSKKITCGQQIRAGFFCHQKFLQTFLLWNFLVFAADMNAVLRIFLLLQGSVIGWTFLP